MKKINFLRLFILNTIFFAGLDIYAQQDSQFTNYMYNTTTINPAYAGNRGSLYLFGLYRAQWIGLEGAPKTLNMTVHSPLGKRQGLGVSIIRESIGPADDVSLMGDFSYSIPINDDDLTLSFGLKGGINLLNVDFTKLDNFNPLDPVFGTNINNRIAPIIGSGIYLNNKDKWYLGLSVPNILSTNYYNDNSISVATERPTYYFMGGYVMNINDYIKFKPAVLSKVTTGAPFILDVSSNFLIYNKLTIGAAYRLNAAFSGLIGFDISNNMMLGYSYDHDLNSIGSYNSGSHEFFIRYELFPKSNKENRLLTPRFF